MNRCGPDTPIIPPEKVRGYLLSPVHPIGKFKARFFYGLGYTQEKWYELAGDLEGMFLNGNVEKSESTIYGVKYIVSGMINAPSGKTARIVTVWILKTGEKAPRLITAYPEDKK